MIDIPAKYGKTTCLILNPTEQKIVDVVALEILKKTGRFSKSEAIRQLINAGAKEMKVKVSENV